MKCVIKQRLEDQFLQNWNSLVQNPHKAVNHITFKTEFKYEEYLNILEIKDATLFCIFRTKIINFPSRQDDCRIYQEKIVNALYVIVRNLEMNIYL